MDDKLDTINSTNEQSETSTFKSVFRRARKLERKPLIGEKQNSNSPPSTADSSAVFSGATDGSPQHGDAEHGTEAPPGDGVRTLRTGDGVFAPVALSQFSSLLFLRVGYLVGNGGLLASLGLLTGAYSILIFTVLSICAISTNGAVEGGGAYFMISRTLGPEMGGAIGFVFYIANVFSCALYASGCVEGLLQGISIAVYPDPANGTFAANSTQALSLSSGEVYLISVGIIFGLLCLCLIGAKMFAKATNTFFYTVSSIAVFVFFALVCQRDIEVPYARSNHLNHSEHSGLFTGPLLSTGEDNLFPNLGLDYINNSQITVMSLFSVLFSGVTGIMAGANMSGELKNPGYSIPRGTLFACLFSFIMYVCLFLATAFTTTRPVLVNNYVFMGYICLWQPLIYIGIALATLCSAMSNMIGASRILRAIAEDKVFGPVFNFLLLPTNCSCAPRCKCPGKNEFLWTLLFTFGLSAAVLAIGDMNSIAPFTSVFFLLSYAMINLSCMMLVWAGAPNFRPKFKQFNMATCGIGFLSSLAMMIILNRKAAFSCLGIFTVLLISLYFYHLKYPSSEMQWGSVAQAVLFHTVRKYLLKLDFRREHVKFWRPHLLLLVANPRTACPLIDMLNDLKKSGIYILGHVQVTDSPPRDLSEEYNRWQELVDHLKVKAFISVTESPTLRQGALQIVRVSGLGALKPNTVMLGFKDDEEPVDFLTMESSRFFMKSTGGTTPIPASWHSLDDSGNNDSSSSVLGQPVLPSRARERVSDYEYVSLLQDILDCGKNLALCRSFHLLDKDSIMRQRNRGGSIDVWPINFMCPEKSTVEDTTSLFTMQLGTILNMVKFWRKNTHFRVFLIVPHEWTSEFLKQQERKVKETLQSVRMNAKIEAVPWVLPRVPESSPEPPQVSKDDGSRDSGGDPLTDGSFAEAKSDQYHDALSKKSSGLSGSIRSNGSDDTNLQLEKMSSRYLSSVNRMIRTHSKEASVTFLNIPPPPSHIHKYTMYREALTRLSDDIGPCVMVHGLSKVTTTML